MYRHNIGRVVTYFNLRRAPCGLVVGSGMVAMQPDRCFERMACRHSLPQ